MDDKLILKNRLKEAWIKSLKICSTFKTVRCSERRWDYTL